eukprot:358335-Chlamydomonas_euryale.AAC.1
MRGMIVHGTSDDGDEEDLAMKFLIEYLPVQPPCKVSIVDVLLEYKLRCLENRIYDKSTNYRRTFTDALTRSIVTMEAKIQKAIDVLSEASMKFSTVEEQVLELRSNMAGIEL